MRLIMIVGPLCAGKDTVALMVREIGNDPEAPILSFSTLFERFLAAQGKVASRENMKQVADELKGFYGQRIFGELLSALIADRYAAHPFAIVCGARYPEDLLLLKEYDSVLVGVSADRYVRYARALKDVRKNGSDLSRDAFAKMDGDPREGPRDALLREASIVFMNNGSREALSAQVQTYFEKFFE
jgi:dephospho-CoA kinase